MIVYTKFILTTYTNMQIKYKNYGTHKVFSIGKKWLSVDSGGVMVWTGTRNWFYIYKRPFTRNFNIFNN